MNILMSPMIAQIIAQSDGGGEGIIVVIAGAIFGLIGLAVALLLIASMWKIFTKAGEPGWAAIIPIFNLFILTKIARQPIWVLILVFIPLVQIVGLFLLYKGLAEAFGKDILYALLLFFIPIIGFPLLAFSGARYQGTPAFA